MNDAGTDAIAQGEAVRFPLDAQDAAMNLSGIDPAAFDLEPEDDTWPTKADENILPDPDEDPITEKKKSRDPYIIRLDIQTTFTRADNEELEKLKERIEGLKEVTQVDDPPEVEERYEELEAIATSLDIDISAFFSDDELDDEIHTKIEDLKKEVADEDEVKEFLMGLGMRLHQMSGHGKTPVQEVCRDMRDKIGLMIDYDFQICPQMCRDIEPPFLELMEVGSPPLVLDGPDIGIWMEDPEDGEEVEQVTVVAEYLKGVERTKRL